MQLLIKNAKIISFEPSIVEEIDLRIIDGEIIEREKNLRQKRKEELVDLSGHYIMPGLVNSHTHLYSALSRGMPAPKSPPRTFIEILQNIWWKLDEALDEESIYYSGLIGAIEAVKYGTTTLVDHHASPNCIRGSLDLLKRAMSEVGVRGILCYETTDRGGMKKRDLGLEENERFVTENVNSRQFRGTIGGHASCTLCNDSLRKLGELASMYDCGVHLHVAEDKADVLDAVENYTVDIIDRLNSLGILRRKSIFAHGVHLTPKQLSIVDTCGAWIVHNPRSNMNNAVGYAPLKNFIDHSALGTDGFPSDMFEEGKFAFFRNAESEQRIQFSQFSHLLGGGQKLISEFFGKPFGVLSKGSPADLIVLDYLPPTPMKTENILGHVLFGFSSSMVEHVMIDGRWVLWNRQFIGIDEEQIFARAQRVADKLWKRIEKVRK